MDRVQELAAFIVVVDAVGFSAAAPRTGTLPFEQGNKEHLADDWPVLTHE